jgi:type IV pilus biogenesis protein CpaD/CtpE
MKKGLLVIIALALLAIGCSNNDNHGNHTHVNDKHEGHHNTMNTEWSFKNEVPKSKNDEPLTITMTDDNNKPITNYDIVHEELLHLILVSGDLSYFDHLHPEYKGDGEFVVNTNFPSGGT